MLPHEQALAKAMRHLYAYSEDPRHHNGAADLGDAIEHTGVGLVGAAKAKRQLQLEQAKQALKANREAKANEYGDQMNQFANGPGHGDAMNQNDVNMLYGKPQSEEPERSQIVADKYGEDMNRMYTQQLGKQLQSQAAVHEAAATTPINGVNTARGTQEMNNYVNTNAPDQVKARDMVRQGMGGSEIDFGY